MITAFCSACLAGCLPACLAGVVGLLADDNLLCTYAVDDDENFVTCGSFIKIRHTDTGYYLSSEEKQLGGGSGQNIVTFIQDPSSHNTLWWVRAAHHHKDEAEYGPSTTCPQVAAPVVCGTSIRLTHMDTKRNLHSHLSHSALSRQQEVTGYGTGDTHGDGGDDWMVECSGKYWTREIPVRFKHVDTGKYLGASSKFEFNQSTCGQGCPIMNHLESFARTAADSPTLFKVDQGIHLSR